MPNVNPTSFVNVGTPVKLGVGSFKGVSVRQDTPSVSIPNHPKQAKLLTERSAVVSNADQTSFEAPVDRKDIGEKDFYPDSRLGAGDAWLSNRGVAIVGASGGIGTDLNTAFQATMTFGQGPETVVTIARGFKPELKDVANPDRTLYSTSLDKHAEQVDDIVMTASVPMKKIGGLLDRAGMVKGNIELISKTLIDAPKGAVVFNATNPSHTLGALIALLRPDITPVGHAGTDFNRAVALDRVNQREGLPTPIVIGDHGPSMGVWNGKGKFMTSVPNRGSFHAENNKGQTMQSQTAQALISEMNRFHLNTPTVLALPLTKEDASKLSDRLGFEVPAGLVSSFPMTADHKVDWAIVDQLLEDDTKQSVEAARYRRDEDGGQEVLKSNREVISDTIKDLIKQRDNMIGGLEAYKDSLVELIESEEKKQDTDVEKLANTRKELGMVRGALQRAQLEPGLQTTIK